MMHCVLKDLITLSKDGEWGKGDAFDGSSEMLCVRGTDFEEVRNGRLGEVPVRHIAGRFAITKLIQPWDVLIETAGGTKQQITGRTVLIRPETLKNSPLPLTCASFSRFMRFRQDLCDPEYVFWYLQYLYHSGHLHQYHLQHTGVARFQWTTFAEREPILLPVLETQRKTGRALRAYDEMIQKNEQRIRLLEKMARRIYREWFVEPSTFEKGSVAGWKTVSLGEVCDVNRAQINPRTAPDEIHYIDISSVSPGRIDSMATYSFPEAPGRARRIVQHGDILWSCVRPNRRSHALVMHPLPDTIASTGFAVLTATKVPFIYLYLATTTDEFVNHLSNSATGSAYPAVTASTFENAQIVVPPASLLERFSTYATPMAEQIHVLHKQNENLRRTRDLLLPSLLSGQINLDKAG